MRFRDLYNLVEINRECHLVIEKEARVFSKTSNELWNQLSGFIRTLSQDILTELKRDYINRKTDRFAELTCSKKNYDQLLGHTLDPYLAKGHREEAENKMKIEYFNKLVVELQPKVINENYCLESSGLPIFFEDTSYRAVQTNAAQQTPSTPSTKGLVVMCHGLQGKPQDMCRLSLYIQLFRPDIYVLRSRANEQDSGCEIYLQGRRLSEEIRDALQALKKNGTEVTGISIVAYSIGGLVARAALPYLEEFKSLFRAYISISTPHLGLAEAPDNIITKGSLILNRLRAILFE